MNERMGIEQRLFIALPLPEEAVSSLLQLQTGLPDMRWTPPEQMHLTLKFLGDVAEDEMESIVNAMDRIDAGAPTVQFCRPGKFIQKKVPPVLWLGVAPEAGVNGLQTRLESLLAIDGFARDKRTFQPHVTLGRSRRDHPRRLDEYILLHEDFRTTEYTLDALVLYSSRLRPRGAEHRIEHAVTLNAVNHGPF